MILIYVLVSYRIDLSTVAIMATVETQKEITCDAPGSCTGWLTFGQSYQERKSVPAGTLFESLVNALNIRSTFLG